MRPTDEPIPATEDLYRWLTQQDVDGNEVLPTTMDLQGTSVDRYKYVPGGELPTHQAGHPERNGVAVTRTEKLEGSMPVEAAEFEFFAVDCPEFDNAAHAKIRLGRIATPQRPEGDRPHGFKPKPPSKKEKLRQRLATAMQIIRKPISLMLNGSASQD